MENRELIVVGGGGFAKEVIWLARDCGFNVIGLLDDNQANHGSMVNGVAVLGDVSSWAEYRDKQFVVAIGNPRTKKAVVHKMEAFGMPDYATLIHPSVFMSDSVSVGRGSIICAGTILTVEIVIGEHVILNLGVTVGHESELKDFVTVAPQAAISGNVSLAETVEVGTGALIRQGLEVAVGGMVGMGAVLTKPVPENTIFAGNPARKLKEIQ